MKALVEQVRGFFRSLNMLDPKASVVPYFGKETGHLNWPKVILEGGTEFQKYFGKASPKRVGGMVWVPVKLQHHVPWDTLLEILHPLLMDQKIQASKKAIQAADQKCLGWVFLSYEAADMEWWLVTFQDAMPKYAAKIWGDEAAATSYPVAFCMRYIYEGRTGEHSIKQKV